MHELPGRAGGVRRIRSTWPALALACALGLTPARARAGYGGGCAGDCNGDDLVTVNELVMGANILLGTLALDACVAIDRNGDAQVTVDEIIVGLHRALEGCDY